MPIEAVKIPQNVQIEDRVIGPLSLRQIIIMIVGGGFSYIMYTMVQRSLGHVGIPLTVVIWTPAAIAAAFAVVNINDLSLLRICFLLFEKMQKPAARTWAPRTGISITIRTSVANSAEKDFKKNQVSGPELTTEQQIAHLTRVVDRAITPMSDAAASGAKKKQVTKSVETDDAIELAACSDAPGATEKPSVHRDDIKVNAILDQTISPTLPPLSDLSVFRDIIPPNDSWHS